jgi:hypothetical protein
MSPTNKSVLMFSVLLFSFACKTATTEVKAAQEKSIDAKIFYPLQVGNKWTYDVNYLGEKRSIEMAISQTNAEGFAIDTSGAQLMADHFGVRDQKRYLLRNPVETGTSWTNVVSVSSIESYKILGTKQPCDCTFGTFTNCVIVESRNRVTEENVLVNEMTFAPEIGIVRLTTVLEAQGKRIPQSSLNLVKFVKSAGAP